jgi:hypothetical protein
MDSRELPNLFGIRCRGGNFLPDYPTSFDANYEQSVFNAGMTNGIRIQGFLWTYSMTGLRRSNTGLEFSWGSAGRGKSHYCFRQVLGDVIDEAIEGLIQRGCGELTGLCDCRIDELRNSRHNFGHVDAAVTVLRLLERGRRMGWWRTAVG